MKNPFVGMISIKVRLMLAKKGGVIQNVSELAVWSLIFAGLYTHLSYSPVTTLSQEKDPPS